MTTAREIAFAAILIAHAAAAFHLGGCADRPVEPPVQVAAAAPPAPPPALPRVTPPPPVEPEATPTPEEKKEFARTGPK